MMDGMQFKDEINKIRALAETPEITIIATGSQASKVLNVFAAQTQLKNVRTVIIDTSNNIKTLTNIQTRILIPDTITNESINSFADNINLPKSDIIVILAALGGHTSSILAPIVAEIGRRMGCLVIAVPILPFSFERERREQAEKILANLKQVADLVTEIDNDHIPKKLKLSDTPSYTARRLQTLLDNLLPAVPFAMVEKLLKEIEEETKKITAQVHRPTPQQIILSASNGETETNPIVVEEIIVEKVNDRTENNQNDVVSANRNKTDNATQKLAEEIKITEKLIKNMEKSATQKAAPDQPQMPQRPKPEKEITHEEKLEIKKSE
ncbi:MAG: hypothetical protein QXU48_08135 [Thermoplasmata archaeon]